LDKRSPFDKGLMPVDQTVQDHRGIPLAMEELAGMAAYIACTACNENHPHHYS